MGRSVLIYSPISGQGHLDSWARLMARGLLSRGWDVKLLAPSGEPLLDDLAETESSGSATILDWEALFAARRPSATRISRIRFAWEITFWTARRYFRRGASTAAADAGTRRTKYKRMLGHVLLPPLYICMVLVRTSFSRIRRMLPSNPDSGRLDPMVFGQMVSAANEVQEFDFVLNLYLDYYRKSEDAWLEFARQWDFRWAGIRFDSRQDDREGYWSSPTLTGILVLDKSLAKVLQESNPQRVIEYLPDVTDVSLPGNSPPLVQTMLRRAQGRHIVFLGGSLAKRKNLSLWFRVVEQSDATQWFFVQVGEVLRHTLTKEDSRLYRRIVAHCPENLMIIPHYLDCEADFNSLIAESDIVFAVYRDFRQSSNMIAKASAFGKPIIVSDAHLMGQQVRKYGIGRVVNETQADEVIQAMADCAIGPPDQECFRRFNNDHSEGSYANAADAFLAKCIGSAEETSRDSLKISFEGWKSDSQAIVDDKL